MVAKILAALFVLAVLVVLAWLFARAFQAYKSKKALDAVDRAPDPIKESEALKTTLDRGVKALAVVESVLGMRKRKLGDQLEQPFYTDERVPVVHAMYVALEEAQKARPEIGPGERYSDHRNEIKDFEKRTQVLAAVLEQAIAESGNHQISEQEEETRQAMIAEYRRRPESSYDAQARMDTLRDMGHNLPFVHIGENMLDLNPVAATETVSTGTGGND